MSYWDVILGCYTALCVPEVGSYRFQITWSTEYGE